MAVGFAHHVGPHPLETDTVSCEKRLVVQPVADQCVRQREQHRRVGIGADRNPFGLYRLRPVVTDRADIDDLDAGAGEICKPAATGVGTEPTFRHLHVLRVSAAEQHHEPAMACDR